MWKRGWVSISGRGNRIRAQIHPLLAVYLQTGFPPCRVSLRTEVMASYGRAQCMGELKAVCFGNSSMPFHNSFTLPGLLPPFGEQKN